MSFGRDPAASEGALYFFGLEQVTERKIYKWEEWLALCSLFFPLHKGVCALSL